MSRIISIVIVIFVAACLPFPHGGYYRPSIEGSASSEMLRRSCGGQVGPEEILRLTVEGVEMRVRFKDAGDALDGHIALTVTAGTRFQFLDGKFVVAGNNRSVEAFHEGLGFYDVKTRKSVNEPIDTVVHGRDSRSVDLKVPAFTPSRFRLQVPPFEVNGKRHTLNPIEVEYRAIDVGIYPFNC